MKTRMLTRQEWISLLKAASFYEDCQFKFTYGRLRSPKTDKDSCWDLEFRYKALHFRLFGHDELGEARFQQIQFFNAESANDVIAGFRILHRKIEDWCSYDKT